MGARGVALLAAVLVAACAQTPAARTTPSPQPTASVKMSAATSPTHVFVVVMENAGYQVALAQPGIAGLAQKYGLATNYHAVSHPSLPNYLALTAGSTFGIADDAYHALPATGIGSQLDAARVSWRAYFQGMSRGCLQSPPPYALKHNPFAYYGGACPTSGQVVDFAELGPDLALPAAQAPRLAWITPDLCNDGHDCGPAAGDRFLQQLVPQVTASAAWQAGGVLFVTWDEDDGASGNHVALLVITPGRTGHLDQPYNHFSLLATIEDMLGVARLGSAISATAIAIAEMTAD